MDVKIWLLLRITPEIALQTYVFWDYERPHQLDQEALLGLIIKIENGGEWVGALILSRIAKYGNVFERVSFVGVSRRSPHWLFIYDLFAAHISRSISPNLWKGALWFASAKEQTILPV